MPPTLRIVLPWPTIKCAPSTTFFDSALDAGMRWLNAFYTFPQEDSPLPAPISKDESTSSSVALHQQELPGVSMASATAIAAPDCPSTAEAAAAPPPSAGDNVGDSNRLTSGNVRLLGHRSFLDLGVAAAEAEVSLDSNNSADIPLDDYGASRGSSGSGPRQHSSGYAQRRPSSGSSPPRMPSSGSGRRRSLADPTSQYDGSMRRSTSSLTDHSRLSNRHGCVTIFFSDLIGFSTWAHELDPEIVMATLDDLYTRLDNIILEEMPGVYKVGLRGLRFLDYRGRVGASYICLLSDQISDHMLFTIYSCALTCSQTLVSAAIVGRGMKGSIPRHQWGSEAS